MSRSAHPPALAAPFGLTAPGEPLAIDLERLIGAHLGVVATSGGGKSGAIRRLLETTHGRVQHLVLDVEDEFYTLRQRYDYVIAGGDGGDAPARPDNAAQLARAALEHGFSLIAQLNDLGADGAPEFVGAFLQALMEAPRSLWRPVLVVVDEAQRFSPRLGETAATAGVKDLLARGRKRGFTAVLASQSLPEVEPRVRALVGNWLLGRATTSLDRKTVAAELGFAPSSDEARALGRLQREFWAVGPALSPEPVLVRVADVATPMPRPGEATVPTPPPAAALAGILAGLAAPSAPPGDSGAAPSTAPGVDVASIKAEAEARGRAQGRREGAADALARVATIWGDPARLERLLQLEQDRGEDTAPAAGNVGPAAARDLPPPAPPAPTAPGAPAGPPSRPLANVAGGSAILDALAWLEAAGVPDADRVVTAALAGVSSRSSAYDAKVSRLQAAGLIRYPAAGRLTLTPEGRARAAAPAAAVSDAELHARLTAMLGVPVGRLISVLAGAYPGDLTRVQLAEAAGVSARSSAYDANVSLLVKLGFAAYPAPGRVRGTTLLFPIRERA